MRLEKIKRKKLIQLASTDEKAFDDFIAMTDLMCVEMLYKLNRQNLLEMNKTLNNRKVNQAYFTLRLSFAEGEVALTPNLEIITSKFKELFHGKKKIMSKFF